MRIFLAASTVFLVAGSPYGPPPTDNEVFPAKANTGCSSIDGCGKESSLQPSVSKFSSDDNRFSQEVKEISTGGRPYWWEGQNNPFKGGCPPGTTGCPNFTSGNTLVSAGSVNSGFIADVGTGSGSLEKATLGSNQGSSECVCPFSSACVHWQLCQNGVMIVDGSARIDESRRLIPKEVSARSGSCGVNMICCKIPTCENVGQTFSLQSQSKLSPQLSNQNIQTSQISKVKTHSVDGSQLTTAFGVPKPHIQEDFNQYSQTNDRQPGFATQEKQKDAHFSVPSIGGQQPSEVGHDSVPSGTIQEDFNQYSQTNDRQPGFATQEKQKDAHFSVPTIGGQQPSEVGHDSVPSGTFHSSQKVPGIKETAPELAIFTQASQEGSNIRVQPETDVDEILGSYLPPDNSFASGDSQVHVSIDHSQQGITFEQPLKKDTTKFDQFPSQGTKFTSSSQFKPAQPDIIHEQPLKLDTTKFGQLPSQGTKLTSLSQVNPTQQEIIFEQPLKPDTTKFGQLPFQGTKFTSSSQVKPAQPGTPFFGTSTSDDAAKVVFQQPQQVKPIDEDQVKQPFLPFGKPDQTKHTQEDSTDDFVSNLAPTLQPIKPLRPGLNEVESFQPEQQVDSGSFEFGVSGQVEPVKPAQQHGIATETKFQTSPVQPDLHSQADTGKLDHQELPGSGNSRPIKDSLSFQSQTQHQHSFGEFGSVTFGSGQQESQHQSGSGANILHQQGQQDSTLSFLSSGVKQPTKIQQQHLVGGFGSSSFSTGQQGSQFGQSQDSVGTGVHQPALIHHPHGLGTSVGGFGSSSFSTGQQGSQFGQHQDNVGTGVHQPALIHHPHGSGTSVGGFGSSSLSTGQQGSQFGQHQDNVGTGVHQPALINHPHGSGTSVGGFGSSSFSTGQQGIQFGQSQVNVGTGVHQPALIHHPHGSGTDLHGVASDSFDRETPGTGTFGSAVTQSPGSGTTTMMMMMGPMLVGGQMMLNGEVMVTASGNPLIAGSCSAGQFCLPKSDCNPYNGFIILYAEQQLAASFSNAPQVPLLGCHVGGISDSTSFCCQLPHPLLGPDGKPFD